MAPVAMGGAAPDPGGDLSAAVVALGAGRVVAIPTDTVYGLAADPSRRGATDQLFALKGRPPDLALPVLVADLEQGAALVGDGEMDPVARRLAERFWPGALTVVVKRRSGLEWDLGGDPATVGLRCPAGAVARALCRSVGPLAVTSANRHGAPPAVTAAEVAEMFGPELLVIDGGRCDARSSTVVDTTAVPPRCVRQGAIAWAEVLAVAGGG